MEISDSDGSENNSHSNDVEEPNTKRRKRPIRPPAKYESESSDDEREGWSESEKINLLNALMAHGSSNIKTLVDAVPSKTESEISIYIFNLERKARLLVKNPNKNDNIGREAPIDKWLHLLSKMASSTSYKHNYFARVLKYIALFEPNFDDSSVLMKDCYEVLASCLKGDAPKHLNRETSLFLLENIQKLVKDRKFHGDSAEVKFLSTAHVSRPRPVRCYGKKRKEETGNSIMNDVAINPFNVPEVLLKK